MTPKPPKKIPIARRRRGFMTIAAGFQFNGGILVCADTQYSSSSIKFFNSKLSRSSGALGDQELWNAVVAASGTDGYMQMAVGQIENALDQFVFGKSDQVLLVDDLKKAIVDVLVEFHHKHIFNHPHYGYIAGPSVGFLFGAYIGGSLALFSTNETAVKEVTFVSPCDFIGSGKEMAEYAVKPLIKPTAQEKGISLDEALLLATHALRVAKKYDPNCGGWSEFAVIYDDGSESEVKANEILIAEDYSIAFDNLLRELFYSVADPDDKHARARLRVTKEMLAEVHTKQRDLIRQRQQLTKALRPKRSTSHNSEDQR